MNEQKISTLVGGMVGLFPLEIQSLLTKNGVVVDADNLNLDELVSATLSGLDKSVSFRQDFINLYYSNEELINYINYSPAIDKILYEYFYKQFRKIIDTHHVNYRRKLLGDTLLTPTNGYNENSSPNQIMDYIIKELDPMIRILFKLSSMTQIEKDSFKYFNYF
jgi:hypothetical protein